MGGTRWLSLVVATAALAVSGRSASAQPAAPPLQPAPQIPTVAQPPEPAATQPAANPFPTDVSGLASVLTDPTIAQHERDEVARRLVARQTSEARNALSAALVQTANSRAQLAVARALAEDTNPPDETFVIPLGALIREQADLTAEAVAALVRYRDNDIVTARLFGAAVNPGPQISRASRIAVIRGLAVLTDKRTAAALVGVALNDAEHPTIRAAAFDALADMTELRNLGRDPQAWRKWWSEQERASDAQFETTIRAARAARLDRLAPRYRQLAEEVRGLLETQYQSVPDAGREEMLLRYLRSPVPEVRVVGARIVRDDFTNDRRIPPAARERLRQMVGDSSAEVRIAVARALHDINDAQALDPLLAQLAMERDAEVLASLVEALGQIGSVRAVPPLLTLIADPNADPAVAEAAVDALRLIGPELLEQNPALAEKASLELQAALGRTNRPGTMELRAAIVDAMVPLRNPELRNLYVDLLKPHEPMRVRRNAVRALGEFRQPWAVTNIANSGALEDLDEAVRFAAVQAMGMTTAPEHADTLYERLKPAVEPSQNVRDEVWNVLVKWFPEFDTDRLNAWADRFLNDQPARRLTILGILKQKLSDAKDFRNLAITQQNLGETFMKLQRPQEAAAEFAAALKYYRDDNIQNQFTEELVRLLMEAYLAAGDFPKATEFAQQSLSINDGYQPTVGSLIRNKAGELLTNGKLEDAQQLVNLAVQMNPPLKEPFLGEVRRIADEIRQKLPPRPAGASGNAQSATNPAPYRGFESVAAAR